MLARYAMTVLAALVLPGVVGYVLRTEIAPDPPPDAAVAASCGLDDGPVPLVVPDPSTIPEGPLGDSIQRGERYAKDTKALLPDHVGADLNCTSCHLNGGTLADAGPWVGLPGVFPEYRSRNDRVVQLPERVDDCFERSMNGTELPPESPVMADLVAYMTWLSQDVPDGREVEGRGFRQIEDPPVPDRANGERLYAQKCAACHGADGKGLIAPDGKILFPPLWGDGSFNIGAGMARLDTAAAFVHDNMPLGQGGTLTPQEAYDVTDFFIHQPRPDLPGKENDWPAGGKPRDARY